MATGFASSLISSSPHIATFLSSSSSSSLHSYHSLRTTTLPTLSSNSPITTPFKKSILFHNPLRPIILLPPPAAAEDVISTAETAADVVEQLYPTTDKGVATVVSALFFLAFVGLSAITIGVIYLAVVDFLQKREKEKFEKEEAGKKGKKKKKKVVGRARAGPRGFGQKLVEEEEEKDD
ncbi:hypothetical protein LR48_Vigan05g191800 [Vigna angularis]|uniref:Transmembrane protein n=2 Tax=Phaseolus angularis TaxID=3914 RepID=A0A0L9UNH9_PHAAN|nr:uncharacterized protein LOC108333543 [Vigna angularis]KAG2371295.1 uncharacterized protein HKW66_Vig0214690 [Vigna angularis]KOM44313.1 hypothetical protein LR48_Vigan05g191800 [Vigna angularis]BAT91842.1 hypothetical protein VIGAN_07047800 [Vigna angularis var. angularis]